MKGGKFNFNMRLLFFLICIYGLNVSAQNYPFDFPSAINGVLSIYPESGKTSLTLKRTLAENWTETYSQTKIIGGFPFFKTYTTTLTINYVIEPTVIENKVELVTPQIWSPNNYFNPALGISDTPFYVYNSGYVYDSVFNIPSTDVQVKWKYNLEEEGKSIGTGVGDSFIQFGGELVVSVNMEGYPSGVEIEIGPYASKSTDAVAFKVAPPTEIVGVLQSQEL